MPSKPNIFLPIFLLGGIVVVAVWQTSYKLQSPAGLLATRSKKHVPRLDSQSGESISRKAALDLADEDLLAIYQRDGATAALAMAKSQPWPNRDDRVYFVLRHLAIEEPEISAAELNSSGLNAFLRGGVVDTILEQWSDGKMALDWAENQLTGELRCKAVAGALGILVKTEPDAAFTYFENLPPGETRLETIRELFAAWGSHDPKAALLRTKDLTPEDAQPATEHVLRGWAKVDPEAAAAWVLQTAPSDGIWIAGVFQSWISHSPEQAKAWFDSLPEGEAKKNAYALTYFSSNTISMPVFSRRRVMDDTSDQTWASKPVSERNDTDLMRWAIQDTEGARAFVEQNRDSPAYSQLSGKVALAISGRDGPSAAMDWALKQWETNRKWNGTTAAVLWDWAEKDPGAVGDKLESMTPEQCDMMPVHLVNNWVKQDPAAAADWVAEWQGLNQLTMIEHVIDEWSHQDPQAAYQWLGNLPPGAGRDAGISNMILKEREASSETLQPWIDLISDTKLREKARRELDEFLKKVP